MQWYRSATCVITCSKLRYTFILDCFHIARTDKYDFKIIWGIWLLFEAGHEEMTQVPRCLWMLVSSVNSRCQHSRRGNYRDVNNYTCYVVRLGYHGYHRLPVRPQSDMLSSSCLSSFICKMVTHILIILLQDNCK